MIKVLIVDDSALMRKLLRNIFEEEGGFEIQIARNGKEAVEENITFQPDVITLDINMPDMDGLTALAHIMNTRKVPVIMVSSLTQKGASATFEALALGAVDYVAKPDGTVSLNIDKIKDELLSKVRAAVRAKLKTRVAQTLQNTVVQKAQIPSQRTAPTQDKVVLIGVSTGGPGTLEQILPLLPPDFSIPVIVAQHMPTRFTEAFASRLDKLCHLNVVEVNKPMELTPGFIYIGQGGTDVVVSKRLNKVIVEPRPEDKNFLWHPSVEVLGRSALKIFDPKNIIGVMLTGMGYDGSDAFAQIKKLGGKTIAESEESAVVFGMPKELIEKDGATFVLPADKIANQLIKLERQLKGG